MLAFIRSYSRLPVSRIAATCFENRGNRQDLCFLIGPSDDLHSDRQPLNCLHQGDGGGGISQQVVMLAVGHGSHIVRGIGWSPSRVLVKKRRNRANRGEQDRELFHLREYLRTPGVSLQ